jgi:hypothetical protein
MKRMIFRLFLLVLLAYPVFAGDDAVPEPTQDPSATYRLFRTQNIYTFLKLDTRSGQVWQVQWGDNDHRFVVPINRDFLAPIGTSKQPTILKPGRFTLAPTSKLYMFVLMDQEDGRTWQIQWGTEKNRLIVAIP